MERLIGIGATRYRQEYRPDADFIVLKILMATASASFRYPRGGTEFFSQAENAYGPSRGHSIGLTLASMKAISSESSPYLA